MDSTDGVNGEESRSGAYIASVIVRAEEDQIRAAFGSMLDAILEQQEQAGSIIDWASVEVDCITVIDPDSGSEYIQFGLGVRALNVG